MGPPFGGSLTGVMSNATTCGNHSGTKPNTIPGQAERCSAPARNRVRDQPGTLFGFTPESRSPSPGIRRPGRASWLRILPAWHAVAVRGSRRESRTSTRQDGQTAHQCRVHRVSLRSRAAGALGQGSSHRARQLVGAQDKSVDEFLAAHPKVQLHFPPTYSSWLIHVELWFAKIQCDLLARGIFTSVADLARKPSPRLPGPSDGRSPTPPAGSIILSLGQLTSAGPD